MDRVLSFQDTYNQGIEVKAGSHFSIDRSYEEAVRNQIENNRKQLAVLRQEEMPKKTFVTIVLHLLTCTNCKENVHTVGQRKRLQRANKTLNSKLQLLAKMVEDLNTRANLARNGNPSTPRNVGILFVDKFYNKRKSYDSMSEQACDLQVRKK